MRPLVIEQDVLLDRLLEAFADLGFEGTSIRELCRHLGVSHNLIHIRYQSKDNAWYRAVDYGFEELGRALTDEPAAGWPTDRWWHHRPTGAVTATVGEPSRRPRCGSGAGLRSQLEQRLLLTADE